MSKRRGKFFRMDYGSSSFVAERNRETARRRGNPGHRAISHLPINSQKQPAGQRSSLKGDGTGSERVTSTSPTNLQETRLFNSWSPIYTALPK
eukprot:scaffold1698_cov149-Skeletonema_menzelii.AAC.18